MTRAVFPVDIGDNPGPLLTPEQAAQFVGVSEDTLAAARKSGELPYVNVGLGKKRETPRYDRADLIAWVAKRKTRACPSSSGKTARTGSTRTTSSSAVADFLEALNKRRGDRRKP